jgi:hypothetical protein
LLGRADFRGRPRLSNQSQFRSGRGCADQAPARETGNSNIQKYAPSGVAADARPDSRGSSPTIGMSRPGFGRPRALRGCSRGNVNQRVELGDDEFGRRPGFRGERLRAAR